MRVGAQISLGKINAWVFETIHYLFSNACLVTSLISYFVFISFDLILDITPLTFGY